MGNLDQGLPRKGARYRSKIWLLWLHSIVRETQVDAQSFQWYSMAHQPTGGVSMTARASAADDGSSEFSGEYLSGIGQKLTVLTADFVAYSELMHRDIASGIAILRKTRSIMANCIKRRNGNILQTPGDFVLSTFENFEEALNAAATAQSKLLEHHLKLPAPEAGHWKIGIAPGEIYAIGDDYFGHAINVAARLQSLAAPGEIYFTDGFKNLVLPENLIVERSWHQKTKEHCPAYPHPSRHARGI